MNESTQIDTRNYSSLDISLQESKDIISKEYLHHIHEYDVVEISDELKNMKISDFTRIYEISKLVYTKDENMLDKLVTVLNAVHFSNSSIASIISSDGNKPRFFLGVINKHSDSSSTSSVGNLLEGSFKGSFNGSEITSVYDSDVSELSNHFREAAVVSAISSVASPREENGSLENYVQGIEKLIDSLHGRKYTIITIADSIESSKSLNVKASLEQLYTELSGFAKTDLSINESSSFAKSDTYSDSFAKSIGTNTSISQSHTSQTGWSSTASSGETKTQNLGGIATVAAGAIAIGLTVATGGAAAIAAGATISGTAAAGLVGAGATGIAGSVAGGLIGSNSKNENYSEGKSGSESDSETTQNGQSETDTKTESFTKGNTTTDSYGKNIQFTVENRAIKSLLDDIDEQIKRLKVCESYGSFSSCTYVLTDDIETNLQASGNFNALIRGENSHVQSSSINTWGFDSSEKEKIETIKSYISKFTHPVFKSHSSSLLEVSPASLVSGKELAIQVGLPKKSVNGLTVIETTAFGRNIDLKDMSGSYLELGKFYHMGQEDESNKVKLDIDSLCSHTFITGSTGAGKSNTIYNILSKLSSSPYNKKFLVIESAKGEYKHAFAKHPSIKTSVYGTNPKKTQLLRLNPFKFPEDIHILEHIDRLIEIFNVCWPMYAAMPAILKDAVERAYSFCGWDLETSEFSCENYDEVIYPNFKDVLEQIEAVLSESSYSADNKGDYIGALSTRIKSLTNGINGQIFTTNDLSDKELFEENVIVDLSRIGSTETRSLIMGLLILRLQEYHIASNVRPNQPLKHITVLEEAHNLLKRTSTEQASEGSNLLGKSVEMISNAIADMRTYGEGFIIADQAPGLLDMSAIRNTNTKIIMRLPDKEDRELVGKSANLNDDQVIELARLEKGVAAVYQNDWLEPVLCKFDRYTKDSKRPELDEELFDYSPVKTGIEDKDVRLSLVRYLLSDIVDIKSTITENELEIIKRDIMKLNISSNAKLKLLQVIDSIPTSEIESISEAVISLYNTENILEVGSSAKNIDEWNKKIIQKIDPNLLEMSHWYINAFLQCLIIEQTKKTPEFKEYAEKWVYKMKEGEVS